MTAIRILPPGLRYSRLAAERDTGGRRSHESFALDRRNGAAGTSARRRAAGRRFAGPGPGPGAPSEGWADVHPAASANAALSPAGAAPAPPAPPRPAAAARIRLGTVLRVELTEGRRRVAHLPLFLLELFCMILPYLLLGGLLFVLIQWVLSRSAQGFAWLGDGLLRLFGNGCVSSLFLLVLIGVAFLFLVGAGRGSYDQQLGRTLFGIVRGAFVLAFRVVFRTCRAVSEALRHAFTSGRFMDRGQRTIQVRNIDVWESPQSQFTPSRSAAS